MFLKSFLIAALAGLAAANPTKRARGDLFTLYVSTDKNPEINSKTINGQANSFWINRPTWRDCTENSFGGSCTDKLVLIAGVGGKDGLFKLAVNVGGGQQVYVGGDGYLSYTKPHTDEKTSGSDYTGFGYVKPSNGNIGYIKYQGGEFAACGYSDGTYNIFVVKSGAKPYPNCVIITMGATPYSANDVPFNYD